MCKFLKGDGISWYTCSLTKKRCGYQKYCTERKQFSVDCQKCPLCKNKSTQGKK